MTTKSKIIGFAIGTIWSWINSDNRNKLISHAKKLDINGVELTFAYKKELYKTRLSKDNISWLKSLSYVSIHAPFDLVKKAEDDTEVIKQLEVIAELSNKVKAKNVIIHPNNLPPLEILKKYNFRISTENLPPRFHYSVLDLEKIFKKYPKMGLCLDVAHAYLESKHQTDKLIKKFKHQISQVHFSGTYRREDHQSLQIVSKDFIYSIRNIKNLNVPIIIEQDIRTKNIKLIQEEIRYIRKLLL